jgi:hypothetical protein
LVKERIMAQDDFPAGRTDGDAEFAARALAMLPVAAVPPALARRVLADYDAVLARRAAPRRPLAAVAAFFWPGVPAWKPATVLAAALLIGLAAGALVPAPGDTSADQIQLAGLASDQSTSPGDF